MKADNTPSEASQVTSSCFSSNSRSASAVFLASISGIAEMIGAEDVGHVGQVGKDVGTFETEAFDNAILVIFPYHPLTSLLP